MEHMHFVFLGLYIFYRIGFFDFWRDSGKAKSSFHNGFVEALETII